MAHQKTYDNPSDVGQNESWAANIKRTYDEFQHESLESIRRSRKAFDKMVSDAQQHDNVRQTLANESLKAMVETGNALGKQMINNLQFGPDRDWETS